MAHGGRDGLRGANESTSHFRDQFFAGIILAAKLALHIAVKAALMSCPVPKLVKASAVVIDLVFEGGLRRHLDKVGARHKEGAVAANPKICARGFNQAFGARD